MNRPLNPPPPLEVPQIPTAEDILRGPFQTSPIVYACMSLWRQGECSWEQAMMLAVQALAKEGEWLMEQARALAANAPPPTLTLTKEQFASLRPHLRPPTASPGLDWKRVSMSLLALLEENTGTVFEDEWHLYQISDRWREAILEEWQSRSETEEEE